MALRHAGQAARRLMSMQNSGSLLQKRFAGDLPAKTNKYVEDWGAFRENVEFTYREFDHADAKYDRPQRDMMGDSK
eukprot:jgi/Astpho2/8062/Aster-x0794